MTRTQSAVPIPLAPPFRPFRIEDARTVARLDNMASDGLLLSVWTERAGPDGDPWEEGRLYQIEELQNGWIMVVLDQGTGIEGVLMGEAHGPEPEPLDNVEPQWVPLLELENMAPGAWYVKVIATDPDHRGKGHGARMMALADEMARAGGHTHIALVVSDANAGAIRLYERAGFTERARRPIYKGRWQGPGKDWILMAKAL